MVTAKQVYEEFMESLICPSKFKKFSLENLEWLKKRSSNITNLSLGAEIRIRVEEIEVLLAKQD